MSLISHASRREFLRLSTLATAGLACGGLNLARAIEPIQRTGSPHFKFSVAAYSYKPMFQGKFGPRLTLKDFIRDCAKLPLDGVELTGYYFDQPIQPAQLHDLALLCFQLGLDISGTATNEGFATPEGPQRQENLAAVKRWIDVAQTLGAPVLRVFAGSQKSGQSYDDAMKQCIAGLSEVSSYAAERGVTVAVENHGGLSGNPKSMLALVKNVRTTGPATTNKAGEVTPWNPNNGFGVNLDSGGFPGDDPYAALAMLAPYAVNVQVKARMELGRRKKVPTDFKQLAAILRQANYRGYIVLEYEEDGNPKLECPKLVDQLRTAFA